jgi:hypothetical protein
MPLIVAICLMCGTFFTTAGVHYGAKNRKNDARYTEIKSEYKEKQQSTNQKLITKSKVKTKKTKAVAENK